METKQLERVDLRTIGLSFTRQRSETMEEAGKLLGYGASGKNRLLLAMKKLEIRPLSAPSVAKFKKGKEYTGPWEGSSRTIRRWKNIDLASYRGEVPTHVLAKAVAIKKALPSVAFEVEALTETRQQRKPVRLPDPFLVAVLAGTKTERVYVDVWDEPEFEKKLYA